jgi:hypothetical protein
VRFEAVPLGSAPGPQVDAQLGVAPADLEAVAGGEGPEGALDQEMRAPIEAEVLKVDSRGR